MTLRSDRARLVINVRRKAVSLARPLHPALFASLGARFPSRRYAGEVEQYGNDFGGVKRRFRMRAALSLPSPSPLRGGRGG